MNKFEQGVKSEKAEGARADARASELVDQQDIFCKIFNLAETQVLVKWSYSDAEEEYLLVTEFQCCGIRAKPTFHFDDLEHCLAMFNRFDSGRARMIVGSFRESLQEMANEKDEE